MKKQINMLKTSISGSYVIDNRIFEDYRGFFYEVWNKQKFNDELNENISFVQENMSSSKKNVLRGLHYQIKKPQGKLVRVSLGSVYDVIVDLRVSSPTFKKWFGVKLSSSNRKLLWVPVGCAHGFYVLSSRADVVYKTTEHWFPQHERCIIWNDKDLSIKWNSENTPILSEQDPKGSKLKDAEYFR